MANEIPHVFRRDDGTCFERQLTLAQSERCRIVGTRYKIDGEEVVRDLGAELRLAGRTKAERRQELARYPIVSYSMGVPRNQAAALRKKLQDKVGFDCVTPDGNVVFESESHRRRVAHAIGVINLDSYYD